MILLILLFLTTLSFGETLYLKDAIYITNSKISLLNLFKNSANFTNEISLNSKFYSSTDILRFLNSDDFIIAGKGIDVKIVKPYPIDKFNEIIKGMGYDVLDTKLPENMDNVYIINITNLIEKDILNSFVKLCYFKSECGTITNIVISSTLNKEREDFYLSDIYGQNATLYYKKGSINIKLKVKIIKKLENNFFLVENYNGKFLTVRAKNE
ncbi:MAG: hypothetical protein ACP5Q5_02360 [Brevinematia bacterium]